LTSKFLKYPSTYSTDAIADYINAHFQTEDNKIRAFYWTASNISYDVDKMVALNNKEALENNSTKILKSKKECVVIIPKYLRK
jgi:tagatose-1,6-bisphosphate aldolase non-catalytic subunit AgaZ/GatZ